MNGAIRKAEEIHSNTLIVLFQHNLKIPITPGT